MADQAEVDRLGHVTRARLTQIMNLLNLASDIQEGVLFLPRIQEGRAPDFRMAVATDCGGDGLGEAEGNVEEDEMRIRIVRKLTCQLDCPDCRAPPIRAIGSQIWQHRSVLEGILLGNGPRYTEEMMRY